MPIYEFFERVELFCLQCRIPFTADMHVTYDAPVAKCPSCGRKDKVQRMSPFTGPFTEVTSPKSASC